jgi:hypothetical protein
MDLLIVEMGQQFSQCCVLLSAMQWTPQLVLSESLLEAA